MPTDMSKRHEITERKEWQPELLHVEPRFRILETWPTPRGTCSRLRGAVVAISSPPSHDNRRNHPAGLCCRQCLENRRHHQT